VDAVSASDPDAGLIKTPAGFVVGYNAQAVVDYQAQIVVAAAVVNCASDGEQLLPMLAETQAMTGRCRPPVAGDSGLLHMGAIVEARGWAGSLRAAAATQEKAAPKPHFEDFPLSVWRERGLG